MALESGELVAAALSPQVGQLGNESVVQSLSENYRKLYYARFNSRLRLCSLIRRAAFVPGFADLAIRFFGTSKSMRRRVASATRAAKPLGVLRS